MKHPELIVFGVDGGVPSYILEKVAEGKFPNFARLMKRGTFFNELRPVHPTVTPTCWSAFQTGTTPEINGITSDLLHLDGPLSHVVSSYHGNYLKSERFWEAAARIGKTSLIATLPVSGPARSPLVRQVGGMTCSCGRFQQFGRSSQQCDIPQQLWFFDTNKKPVKTLRHFSENSSPVIPVMEHVVSHNQKLNAVASASEISNVGAGRFQLQMNLDLPGANYHQYLPFSWEIESAENGFVLYTEHGLVQLRKNEWSTPFQRILKTADGERCCSFRFGCFMYEDGWLIFSQSTGNINENVSPELVPIIEKLPPVPVNQEYVFVRDPVTADLAFDAWRFGMEWNCDLIKMAQEQMPSDIVVTYFGNTDTVNHFYWPAYCGAMPADPEQRRFASYCMEKIYEQADWNLGFLMDEIADENTAILVLSDHGSMGTPDGHDFNDPLVKAGLVQYSDASSKKIDWSKTRAAAVGFGNFFVNLQGRETDGIVPPSEYDATVAEIIRALQDNLRGPDGAPYLAFAARNEEAGFFGMGGDRCGDVVYGTAYGHSAITVHAEQIPTARHKKFGSIACLGILSAPGIPANYSYDAPVNLQDLAPTLCDLLGYPLPTDCNGRVISQLINK